MQKNCVIEWECTEVLGSIILSLPWSLCSNSGNTHSHIPTFLASTFLTYISSRSYVQTSLYSFILWLKKQYILYSHPLWIFLVDKVCTEGNTDITITVRESISYIDHNHTTSSNGHWCSMDNYCSSKPGPDSLIFC